MIADRAPEWTALLIGGPSVVGKSTVAKQIARHLGVPWLQVDDLRLALQWSRVTLPEPGDTEKLYFFDETPNVWRLPPERLRNGFIGVGEVLSPAIGIVITNHLALAEPIVLEGDGILPSVLARPDVQHYEKQTGGRVRMVCIVPADEQTILATMLARGRGITGRDEMDLRANARANWLFGRWLADEARRAGLPTLDPRPWGTLGERVLAASRAMIVPDS
ncbi:MAG: hypothetical protein ACRDJH_05105 [Thermomicrobiales bacterium]